MTRIWACCAMLLAMAPAAPAQAGDWQYDPARDLILYGSVPVSRWYGERPSIQPPAYRVPAYVAPCPHRLCGYPLPIYKARRPWPVRAVRPAAQAVVVHRSAAHVDWCAARYRSYDVRTDTYQPYHGPRRYCWSPYR